MKWIQRIYWLHLLAAVAALAVGYWLAGAWVISLLVIFFGSLWATARIRGGSGVEGLMLYVFLLASAAGFWAEIPAWLLLVAGVASLGAWDLDHFLQRLSAAERVEFETGLGREHLRRLALVEGLGLAAGLLALTARSQIGFWGIVLLALLAVIGLSRIVAYVRKEAE